MARLKQKGDYNKTTNWLKKLKNANYDKIYHEYGRMGVQQLAAATPIDSGLTASSWEYDVIKDQDKVTIEWYNLNSVNNGKYTVNVAILIQYGHATKNGGFVSAYDFVNPAMKTVFEKMADSVWKEVTRI